ncbi:hypothetical protein IV102_24835 [bacterium]|nr:hypothetical protein [bacterium]
MSLINSSASQFTASARSLADYQKAFKAVDQAISEEIARENFGGPNHNDQWTAAGDILTLTEGAGWKPPAEGIGQCRGYLNFLAALPEKPDAQSVTETVKKVSAAAPQAGPERKGYLTAVALAGSSVAAQFATESTLAALMSLGPK